MPFYPPSRPRPVQGGLTARSTRGAIGASWWSQRFIGVLEGFALGSRLTRGRAYARRGQVVCLEVAPGVVTARVQGSRATPYRVALGLAPFPTRVWAAADAALAAEAIHAAALLAGQLPPELEGVFESVGARLFPRSVDELRLSCSCPDWEVPCKHLAASFYLLAERFDDDPFELLHWRGRPREVLLARVRELRCAGTAESAAPRRAGAQEAGPDGPDAGPDGPDGPDGPGTEPEDPARRGIAGARLALVDLPEAAPSPVLFWTSPVPMPASVTVVEAPADLLLRQLPVPPSALGGEDLVQTLRRVYAALPDPDDVEQQPAARRGRRG